MNFGEYNFSSQADDASFILRDFCSFQHQFNNQSNSHPEHWTIGVLLTGKDLYFNKDGQIKDTSGKVAYLNIAFLITALTV